jgi:WD40 repeat protein/serine/threonine protein kinase
LLELPEARRRAWLVGECGTDEALLREVWRAYEDGVREDGFLASPLLRGGGESPGGDGGPAEDERRVGPYRLESVLGSGGMGTVWLASRVDGQFEKRVALKIVKRGMDTDAVVRRFLLERQVLADLEHPRIARLLDGGTTAQGLPYLVMELVEGRPLLRYCDEEGLGVDERLRLFQKVCETVHFAHGRQVVHRDLKPGNVLVGADGEPKLLDFGIAKLLADDAGVAALESTRTSERFLSPRYASPEQLRGEPVGPASDVYALGVILYELLTGLHPHGWTTTSWREFELEVLEGTPMLPSRALLWALNGAPRARGGRRSRVRRLRGDLDTIVLSALRKEPERRYASAEALARDIGRHLAGHTILARPDRLLYRASKYVRRNRGFVLGTGTFVLLLSIALGVVLDLYAGSLRAERAAQWEAYVGHVAAAENAIASARVREARAHLDLAPEALRAWEWRHLSTRLDRALRTLDLGSYGAFALDAERGRLAVAREQSLEVLDAETLELLVSIDPVLPRRSSWKGYVDASFSPDGALLASVWDKSDLFVHDLADEGRLATRGPAGMDWCSAAFHPRSERLVAGSLDGSLCELDPRSGVLRVRREVHRQQVGALAFDPEGRHLASGSWDERVLLWDAEGLELRHELLGHTMAVISVAFAPDGERLVSCSLDGTVRVWDVASGAQLHVHHVEGSFDGAALFTPDGEALLLALRGGIALVDARSRKRHALLLGHVEPPTRLALDAGRGRVWSKAANELKEWDLETQDVRTFPACEYSTALGFDAWSQRFASAGPDGRIRLWSWPAGRSRGMIEAGSVIMGLRFHPTLDRLYVLDGRGVLSYYGPSGRHEVARAVPSQGLDSAELSLHMDATGEHVACFLGRTIELRDADGSLLRRFEPRPGVDATEAAFDARGLSVAAGTADGHVLLWDARSGGLRADWVPSQPNSEAVFGLAFDHHRDTLAAGFADGTIVLWDSATGRELAVLSECHQRIDALAFHPDGDRLASGSIDGTVRLWDVPSGRLVVTLSGHTARIASMEFSPDGTALLSVSDDASVRVWGTVR